LKLQLKVVALPTLLPCLVLDREVHLLLLKRLRSKRKRKRLKKLKRSFKKNKRRSVNR
jgi:hypothetical protein